MLLLRGGSGGLGDRDAPVEGTAGDGEVFEGSGDVWGALGGEQQILRLCAARFAQDNGKIRSLCMRAEAQAMVNEIEESLVLLRRRL